MRAALKGTSIELGKFFRNSRYFDTTHGKMQGHVSLAGTGRSLAQVMGVADGHVEVALAGGSVCSLMVSLAGLQLFDALILYVTGDNRIPILCALGRLNFQHGTVIFDRTLLDTQKSILHVTGQVALQSQVVNVEVKADAKPFDLLDLHGAGHGRRARSARRRSRSAAPSRSRRRSSATPRTWPARPPTQQLFSTQ